MVPETVSGTNNDTNLKKMSSDFSDINKAYLYWQKYRWEFMRRDFEYQKAYSELDEYLKNTPDSNLGKGYKQFGYNSKFGLHWCAGSFPNPKKSFEEAFDPKHLLLNFTKSYHCELRDKKLAITIDLAKVNSIHALKHQISKEIEDGFRQTNFKKKTKKQIDYSVILMVGDLRADGLTYEQIAKKVFPQDFKNNLSSKPESAVRKVGQYYATYKKLINGGYKDLTFP